MSNSNPQLIRHVRKSAFCLVFLWGVLGTAFAQQAPSPLTGKVVHLFNPFPDDVPLVDLSGSGYAMTEEGPNWYRFDFNSIGGSLQPWMVSFQIRTGGWKRFGPNGMTTTDAPFDTSRFGSATDIWIVVDPSGPADAAPKILTKPPGTVHIFNPWPSNGPKLNLNGLSIPMQVDKENCGWYMGYTLPGSTLNAYFTNVADGQAWGKGGLDDKTPFDLTALYGLHGTDLWIASQTEISGAFSGKLGSCTYDMAAIVHDMAQTHPSYGVQGGLGMVKSTLGADQKPEPTTSAPPHFNTWFNSNPDSAMPFKGAETCVNLEMGKSDDGLWEYDSKNVPVYHGYFPIDDFNTLDVNQGPSCPENAPAPPAPDLHNFGFCMESHANFKYQKGQVFEFRGDDDVWVFINNKMVLDIGGVHAALSGKVDLDTLGLVEGQTYPWDFFFCERKMCGSSLRIKTTIYFKQQRALTYTTKPSPGGGTNYEVVKWTGGTGACGNTSSDSLTPTTPGPLTFVLYRVGGDSLQELPKSTVSFGGINVEVGSVSVDTSKVIGLASGQYRIVFYETASPRLRESVPFTVSARNVVEFDPPFTVTAVLGTSIKVVAANRFKDSLVAGAVPWIPGFTAGISVYSDSTLTAKVVSKQGLTTSASGFDTLWVVGDPTATADRTDTLSIPGSGKTVRVTFTLPPLDLPQADSAAIFDDDGDGRGDRLEVHYDRDITTSLPKAVAYRWPASTPADSGLGTDLASKLVGGKTLVFKGKPLSAGILTAGAGVVKSTYSARGRDSIQVIPIQDRIGPVIRTATMHMGKTDDTLRLEFSEPLSPASQAAKPEDLFGYRLGDSLAVITIAPRESKWDADATAVSLVFPANSQPEPMAGDFVRLNNGSGLAADMAGNPPGPQTQFQPIIGDKRRGIMTLTRWDVLPNPALFAEPAFVHSLEGTRADVKQVVATTGRMGFLLEADLGDFAVGDGITAIDPARVTLEYEAAFFTNLGVPVASSQKQTLKCTDGIFKGDCRSKRGRLFIGWNYATRTGSKLATGAYVALFSYHVTVQGKRVDGNSLKETWGILRRN